MSAELPIKELEAGIEQFYERYSAKKVALAAFLVGVFTIGLSFVAYALTGMAVVATIAFGLAGVLSGYLTMIFVVPPASKLAESCGLMCAAIHEPSRIREIDKKGVKLIDGDGILHTLTGPELEVWTTKIVPYFMQTHTASKPVEKQRTERKLTASERKYIEERRREVLEIEKRIAKEREQLEQERKALQAQGLSTDKAGEKPEAKSEVKATTGKSSLKLKSTEPEDPPGTPEDRRY